MLTLELEAGYREETNEVILGLCLVERGEIIETLAVLAVARESEGQS